MKCNNCNSEIVNGAEFCGNCGSKLEHTIQPVKLPEKNKKNKKKLIIIFSILFVISLLVVILIIILNKSKGFDDPFQDVDELIASDYKENTNVVEHSVDYIGEIEKKYKNKELTNDEYIMEISNVVFDKTKNVQISVDGGSINYLISKMYDLREDLSLDTVLHVSNKITLGDVEWDISEEDIAAVPVNNVNGINNNSNNAKVNKLKKAILSKNQNFIIYYSDKGINAVTDEYAQGVADYLEEIVLEYEEKYDLSFQYNSRMLRTILTDLQVQSSVTDVLMNALIAPGADAVNSVVGASAVLLKNKIDLSYLTKAMPVYLINTEHLGGIQAMYMYEYLFGDALIATIYAAMGSFCELAGSSVENCAQNLFIDKLWSTVYSLPLIVIGTDDSDMDSAHLIIAHELFHHYQKFICGGKLTEMETCKSGLFTIETTANLAAINATNINSSNTLLNQYHAVDYIQDVSTSVNISGNVGYSAYIFAYLYADMVKDGTNILFDSLKYTNALEYIVNNSGNKYKDVLLALAEKNLTLEYDNKLLLAEKDGVSYYPNNYKDLGVKDNKVSLTTNYSSMQYFYISPGKFVSENPQISFNGKSNDLTLLLFVKEDGSYKYLYTHNLDKEFVVNVLDFGAYDEVVFCVVNSSAVNNIDYEISVFENGSKTPTVTAETLKLKTLEETLKNKSSFICSQVVKDDEYYIVSQVKVGFDKMSKINDLYLKTTYKMINYKEDDIVFELTTKTVSGLLYAMEKLYEEKFKYVDTKIVKSKDKYSIAINITDNQFDMFKENYDVDNNKNDIINALYAEGFSCK